MCKKGGTTPCILRFSVSLVILWGRAPRGVPWEEARPSARKFFVSFVKLSAPSLYPAIHESVRQLKGQERELLRIAFLITGFVGTFGKQRAEVKYATVPMSALSAPGCGAGRRRIRSKAAFLPRPPVSHDISVLVGDFGKFAACPGRPLVYVVRQMRPVDPARVSAALDRFPWFSLGSRDEWKLLRLTAPLRPEKRQSYQVVTLPKHSTVFGVPGKAKPSLSCGASRRRVTSSVET